MLLCEVLNFVGDRLLLNKGGLQPFLQKAEALGFVGGRLLLDNILLAGLTAWGLPGIGFLATGLLGMAKKTSAPQGQRLQDRIKGSRKRESGAL